MKKLVVLYFLFFIGCSGHTYPWDKGISLEQALEKVQHEFILLDFYSDN